MEISIAEVLAARDRRVETQRVLLDRFGGSLICFTMNIPGPVKVSDLIRRGYEMGLSRIRAQMYGEHIPIAHFEETREPTGFTAYFSVDAPGEQVKALTVQIEDSSPLGRLFDMDVLLPDGKKTDREQLGLGRRKCLICEQDAAVCGRSRAHSVPELQKKVREILWDAVREDHSRRVAEIAVKSLFYEVCTTPKAGLVDRANSGSHKDMDIFTFADSTAALFPYFEDCAAIGMDTAELSPKETFARLRFPGKLAEQEMYRATGGVNTHKGAIFSMGLACGAAGRLWEKERTPEAILAACAEMVHGVTEELRAGSGTAGKDIFRKYGVTGVRGQAEQGFPAVRDVGLPALEQGLSQGLSLNDAGCGALLALITAAEDTNLIARSDRETQQKVVRQISQLLKESPYPEKEMLEQLDREFQEKNLSPGGSADLLALCYFLHFLL